MTSLPSRLPAIVLLAASTLAHTAFPGLGHIGHAGAGYQWRPLNYDGAPSSFGPP